MTGDGDTADAIRGAPMAWSAMARWAVAVAPNPPTNVGQGWSSGFSLGMELTCAGPEADSGSSAGAGTAEA